MAKAINALLGIAFAVTGWAYADAGHYFLAGVCLTLTFVCELGVC